MIPFPETEVPGEEPGLPGKLTSCALDTAEIPEDAQVAYQEAVS